MEYRRFGGKIVARLNKGEEIMQTLGELAKKEGIKLGSVSILGAINKATIGCFNDVEKKFYSRDYSGIYEIAGFAGTISTMDGQVYLHVHGTISDESNNAFGGHVKSAVVSATAELVIDVIDGEVDRKFSEEIGLNLFEF